ncbi:unnamed protein product [Paramecium pentaurelia]|uniref:Uncharacterized protein n=1 Tax=Paramecium pentaurelia TaxID=43138 RepID=A0A8S1WNX3_9CILI|nr:unnamed protein product [Paramecium pentaurelia]
MISNKQTLVFYMDLISEIPFHSFGTSNISKLPFKKYNQILLNQSSSLRGGGCCSTNSVMPETSRFNQFPQSFASNLIVEKASQFNDKYHQDDVLCAIIWFQNHKEHIQKLCKNETLNLQHYDLIERTFESLIKQLVIYLKVSGYIFYTLLQICNDLLRVIFYYQQINEERYMQEVLQQKLKEYISETEEQISVESQKIWLTGTDFELQMIKIGIAHLRTNSETGTNLIKAVLFGIASSISQLKPSEELLDALMEAGKYLLLNFYDKQIKNPLKIYELYYFFENLKWSIIFQLKEGYSVKQTINQLTDGYNKYIGASQNWLIHFCWINLISGLMSYRPIIYRAEVEQMLNQKHHISWNQLIVSNQIVLMPYDKTKGKVKYSGRGTFIIREFQNLKLFQEYLLDEQVNSIKLFSQYLNFDFSSQQKSQINLQDLTISLFTNIDDLEILSSLQIALLNCYTKIKENLNLIDNQTSKDEVISMQNKTEIKIYKQDIQYLINQQKDSFLQLLYIFYEIDIIRIKETEIINNIEQILRSNEKNLGLLKDKTYIEQMPNLNEIRVEAENRFVKQLQQLPNLIVQFTQILISYEDIILDENNVKYVQKTQLKQTLIKYQQELEIFIQVINNFLINFICNIKKIKNNIKQINSQISLTIPQEQVSQKDISEQLIQFYNSALIKNLSNQILQVYSTDWVEKYWEFNNLNEFGKNIKRCSEIALIFKFYKKLLRIQQQKINVLQYEDNIAKQYFNNKNQHTNLLENESIATDQIKSLVLERKVMIQEYFDKYPNLILNKQEINEINIIEDKIREDIISLQQKQWNQELKLQSIMILQEALNKLSQLGLNKVNKSTLKEEINLNFTNSLSNLNKKMYGDDQKAEQTELLPKNTINDLDSQIFFNFESSITQIIAVIINTKRLRRIIQQNYNLFNWSSEIWGSEKKMNFNKVLRIQQLNYFILFRTVVFLSKKNSKLFQIRIIFSIYQIKNVLTK